MTRTSRTCGELYTQIITWALERYADNPLAMFACGSIAGQAEKVYLGACLATMVRPAEEYRSLVCEIAGQVARIYGLDYEIITPGGSLEVWVIRWTSGSRALIGEISRMATQDMHAWDARAWTAWHGMRAKLCGVPMEAVDCDYHLREGYGKRCEP